MIYNIYLLTREADWEENDGYVISSCKTLEEELKELNDAIEKEYKEDVEEYNETTQNGTVLKRELDKIEPYKPNYWTGELIGTTDIEPTTFLVSNSGA